MFTTSLLLPLAALVSSFVSPSLAATAEQWRSRSIYQIITDRYALSPGANLTACDPGNQTWCGGTWQTIQSNLDYIQNAGFTAIWISPVAQNYDGPRTAYGDAYHGYWTADFSQINPRYGSSDDLKSLSSELHRRGMYLMVDVVVNNVMSTSVNLTESMLDTFYFKEAEQYHPYCSVNWSNLTSEQECWLGDTTVALPDLNTEDTAVQNGYAQLIQELVQEYDIDGLRIDAAKHINVTFWKQFAQSAGVFTIGEVMESDVAIPSMYQGPNALDSVLHYPMYYALVDAFAIPGKQNISALVDFMAQSKAAFQDTTVLGNFIENQDNPRWANISVDPVSLKNAMVFNWMTDGIPIVYYGQEQGFYGNADPYNREPMWPSGYARTNAYNYIASLNQFRNFLVNTTSWATSNAEVLATTPTGIAVMKGNVISIMSNIGSPPQNLSTPVYTPWPTDLATVDVLSCKQYAVGSNGTVEVNYSTMGGLPVILIPESNLTNSNICGFASPSSSGSSSSSGRSKSAAVARVQRVSGAAGGIVMMMVAVVAGMAMSMF